ncbi:MAG: hypothetical protein HFG92_05415 [Dorea sp.]|jgi:predicted HAD superfamily hydrolase|nr:hypothetical protein [Dorea sp.]
MQIDLFYTDIDKLINYCIKYDVISFDIFDTSLVRLTDAPEDVFDIVGKIIGDNSFRNKRIRAQKIAEKKYRKSTTLTNIYQEMVNFGYVKIEDKEEILKKELEIEDKVCIPRLAIRDLVEKLSEIGKTVVFLSDMYISGDYMELILRNKGFLGFQNVIVSCDIGMNKKDSDAYRYLKELYPFQKILHIGDNIRTDYINAKKEINSVLIRKVNKTAIDKLFILTIRENKLAYNWGYTIMSKMIYGFAVWLEKELKNSNISKVLFLTREGYFFKNVFGLLGFDKSFDSKLFYASRRSMLCALAAVDRKIVGEYILKTRCYVRELYKIFNLEDDKIEYFSSKFKIASGDSVDCLEHLDSLMEEIVKESKEYIFEQYELLRDYIYGFDLKDCVAVVDIGWNGTMQYLLGKLLEKIDKDIKLTGYYLGEFTTQGLEYDIIKCGYLCNTRDIESIIAVVNGAYILEQCFTPNMGSTIGYKREDNSIVPILKEYKQNEIITEIQQGIIDAVNVISKYQDVIDFNVRKDKLLYPLKYPDICYAKILGDIEWSDIENYRFIAKPEKIIRYITSPKRVIPDFQKSGWKSAFLLRLFRLRLPYYMFYRIMKGFY